MRIPGLVRDCNHDQHYIAVADPAVVARDDEHCNSCICLDTFIKEENGTVFDRVLWAGPSVITDWCAPESQTFWDERFDTIFNAENGVNNDG